MTAIFKSALLYFALVFATGFLLGTIRTLWIAPAIGERAAETTEAPIMVVVSFFAARRTVKRLRLPERTGPRLGMGSLALLLMLVAEFTLVLWLRGVSIREYLAHRDPVAEAVYYLALLIFAIMPLLVGRGDSKPRNP